MYQIIYHYSLSTVPPLKSSVFLLQFEWVFLCTWGSGVILGLPFISLLL